MCFLAPAGLWGYVKIVHLCAQVQIDGAGSEEIETVHLAEGLHTTRSPKVDAQHDVIP